MGVIHRNLDVEAQAREVRRVKRFESGIVYNPITLTADQTLADAKALQERYNVTGFPVVDEKGHVVGIVTNRDLRFETDLDKSVADVMTKDKLITVSEGISLEDSKKLLHEHRIEKLLVVDDSGCLTGMITIKDIEKIKKYPIHNYKNRNTGESCLKCRRINL